MEYIQKIARRELRDFSSDWRVLLPLISITMVFPVLLVIVLKIIHPYLQVLDSRIIVERMVLFGAMLVGFLPTCFSLILALESFVGEKERNTLETLFSLPISDLELFLGKFLAVLLPSGGAGVISLAVFVTGVWIVMGFGVATDFFVLMILLSFVETLVMIAGAVLVSSHTSSIRAANLLSMFIIIPISVTAEMQAIVILMGKWEILWLSLLAQVIISCILIRIGTTVFNREEILTRENGTLNLKVVVRKLGTFLGQTPRAAIGQAAVTERLLTPWRLYTVDIPQLLQINVRPITVVSLLLLGGGFIGFILAQWYGIPISVDKVSNGGVQTLSDPSLGVATWTEAIFLHNARAVLLASALALFTFGVGAMITLMAPMGITGFLAGGISVAGASPLTFVVAFILPHGIVEFPALVIAGAFSLRVGMSVMSPPKGFTIGDSLLLALVNWVKIVPLVIPLLMVAALLETNLTPQVIKLLYGG